MIKQKDLKPGYYWAENNGDVEIVELTKSMVWMIGTELGTRPEVWQFISRIEKPKE